MLYVPRRALREKDREQLSWGEEFGLCVYNVRYERGNYTVRLPGYGQGRTEAVSEFLERENEYD
jgi:hypothetical protein